MFLILAAFPLWVFWPALFGGKMVWGSDTLAITIPFNVSVRRSLDQGSWPHWMPELLGGVPGIAATNLIFLHPSRFLMHLLRVPVTSLVGLDSTLHIFLSGLGLYGLLRFLAASRGASLLGALVFAASGTQLSLLYAGHEGNLMAIAMMPWTFWGLGLGLQGRGRKGLGGFGLCGLALALQLLSMGMQIFAYTAIGLAAFGLWLLWSRDAAPEDRRRKAGRLLLGGFISLGFALLLSAPQILTSFVYKRYSWREDFSYEAFTSWSFNPAEALTWAVPGYFGWCSPSYRGSWEFCLSSEYMGLLPWVLAGAALAALGGRSKGPVRFFAAAALLSFLVACGKYTPLHLIFYHLPIYKDFRTWTRFLCLFTLSISILAGLGWDALASEAGRLKARQGALVSAGLLFLVAILCLFGLPPSAAQVPAAWTTKVGADAVPGLLRLMAASSYQALGVSALLGWILWIWPRGALSPVFHRSLLAGTLFLQLADLSPMHRRYINFSDPRPVLAKSAVLSSLPDPAAPEPYRIYSLDGIWSYNGWMIQGLEDFQGYHGMMMKDHRRMLQAFQGRDRQLLDLMNVRYILSPKPIQAPGLQALGGYPAYVYANPSALSRAFFVGKTLNAADDDEAYRLLAQPSFDPGQEAILLKGPAFDSAPGLGRVTWLSRKPLRYELEVESAAPRCLVLSQSWYPDWNATLDGKPTEIYKADGALTSVLVGPGTQRLVLEYRDPLIQTGLILAALGILLLSALLWFSRPEPLPAGKR